MTGIMLWGPRAPPRSTRRGRAGPIHIPPSRRRSAASIHPATRIKKGTVISKKQAMYWSYPHGPSPETPAQQQPPPSVGQQARDGNSSHAESSNRDGDSSTPDNRQTAAEQRKPPEGRKQPTHGSKTTPQCGKRQGGTPTAGNVDRHRGGDPGCKDCDDALDASTNAQGGTGAKKGQSRPGRQACCGEQECRQRRTAVPPRG